MCLPRIGGALLDELPRLRGLVLCATGYVHLDVDELARRRVGLSVLPDHATTAIAEHAVAMLFALAARLHLAHDRSRGATSAHTSLRGVELARRTLGIVSAWWRDEVMERGATMWGERLLAAVLGEPLDAVTWPPTRVRLGA